MTEITANYDETWKEAITEYFDSFLQFFYPEIYAKVDWNKTPISLDKELEQITAAAETKKGYNRKQIVDLYKVIDIMMALSTKLQTSFEEKITNYQEDRKVPLLSNIEIRAIERTTKITRREDIIKLLQKRFGNLPESLVENINQIDDIAVLESLLVETIAR